MPPVDANGWNEWSKFVLKELERLNECFDNMSTDIQKIYIEIATLKVKAGMWGLIGGAIPVIFAIVYVLIQKK